MRLNGWVTVVIVLLIGYAIGASYPQWWNRLTAGVTAA